MSAGIRKAGEIPAAVENLKVRELFGYV